MNNNRIREIREEKRITQVRLSTELGVAQESISAYENGKNYPNVENLIKLAGILDVSIDYMLGISSVRNPEPKDNLPAEEAKLLSMFRKLGSIDKVRLTAYAEGMMQPK